MKKTLFLVSALAMLLVLCACGADNTTAPQASPAEGGASEEQIQPAASSDAAPAQTENTTGAANHALVVYFSRTGENYTVGTISTGNTAIVGDLIAESVGADVFEIVPVTPYPDNYNDCLEVATQEQRANARPEYTGEVADWEDYDVVFFGYPIWWGDLPMIAYTFLENHDWTGKTVIPFNTHEGSGQAGTQRIIGNLCSGATVLDGLAVQGNTAQNDRAATEKSVNDWLSGMVFFG